jgi:hypothetical protein
MAVLNAFAAQLLAACILIPLVYRLVRAALDPLRSVPGPPLARFTRLWYSKALSKGDFEQQNIELHRKHGAYRAQRDTDLA